MGSKGLDKGGWIQSINQLLFYFHTADNYQDNMHWYDTNTLLTVKLKQNWHGEKNMHCAAKRGIDETCQSSNFFGVLVYNSREVIG